MSGPLFTIAGPGDRAEIEALLDRCALPAAGLEAANVTLIAGREEGRLVACAAIERFGDACVLRSLAIAPERRGSGLARRLIERLLQEAGSLGCAEAYLLTLNVQKLAARYGFTPVPREAVSPTALASPEFGLACCSSATVMRKSLNSS